MDERLTNNEAFRNTIGLNEGERKWKKIGIIFIVSTIVVAAVMIVFIILYATKDEKEESDMPTDTDKPIPTDTDAPIPTDTDIPSDEQTDEPWDWQPVGDKIKTKWGLNLDPEKVWEEYPRPQLERKDWMNLNGVWKYSIRNPDELDPEEHDGHILVPFPIESSLSGVMKNLSPTQVLYYEKTVTIPEEWQGKNILLNFGAVDWKCEVFINKRKVGEHTGGYTYFYFDITSYLKTGRNKITLRVTDITDSVDESWGKYQPVGKQTLTPNSIRYTPASGIWQPVWLEPVSSHYIEKLSINNDYDSQQIRVTFIVADNLKLPIEISVKFGDKIVAEASGKSNEQIAINVSNNFKPWSPTEPNLYIINAKLKTDGGELLDSITSYTAIRKVESKQDSNGKLRIFLNDKPIFNLGPLDQGYWPDGIYTPPSEEAMIFDIQTMKDLGFNTLRKHAKTECFRWYYQCDKLGMLVWQDMPSGNVDGSGKWNDTNMNGGSDFVRTKGSKDNYYKEWGEIIENLKFFQCIIIWTPFNEAWGQFETEATVNFTKGKDNLRLIDAASGGNHRECGNFVDIHSYPGPDYKLKWESLINVIGEYGGLGLEIKNHTWKDENWSYYPMKDKAELIKTFVSYIDELINLVPDGISGAIYTQVTDVEGEINGLMTYDREEIKVNDTIREANERLINSLSG